MNKKIYFFFIFLLLSCASSSISKDEVPVDTGVSAEVNEVNRIVGTWEYENDAYMQTKLRFNEDFTVEVIFPEDEPKSATYVVNFEIDPPTLDVNWDEFGVMETIIRFIDNTKIQIENNDIDTPRPVEFSDNSEILVRVD